MGTALDQALKMREGKRLVFTNGVFDILHAGHVDSLRRAKALGDLLFVGLNTDASARRLGKGANRPLNCLEDRSTVLSAVRYVDFVVSFDEDTPLRLIGALKPEIYAKGGDYTLEQLPEAPLVQGYGGQVVILPLLEGHSTTTLIERCQDQ